MIEQTAPLTEFDVSNLLSHPTANTPRPTVDAVSRIASAYGVVLITPPEYLPRATHIEFLRRGFVADIIVYLTLRHAQNRQLSEGNLLIIREVLRRTVAHLGMVENVVCPCIGDGCRVADVSRRFQRSSWTTSWNKVLSKGRKLTLARMSMQPPWGWWTCTKGTSRRNPVFRNCLRSPRYLVRLAKKGEADPVVDLARRYTRFYDAASPDISRRPSLLLIDALVQNTSPSE